MKDALTRIGLILSRGIYGAEGDDAARLAEIREMLAVDEAGALTHPDEIAALTDDEVAALHQELIELSNRILDGSADGIERYDTVRLTEIAESVESLRHLSTARVEENARQEAEVAGLMERIRGEAETPPGEGAEGGDAEVEGEPAPAVVEPPAEAEPDEAVVVEPAEEAELVPAGVVAAAAPAPRPHPTLAEIAARVPRSHRAAQPAEAPRNGLSLARTEHPFIRAIDRGENVTLTDLANLMIERWGDFSGAPQPGGGEQKFRLGRIALDYPEERHLRSSDGDAVNSAKVEAVCADAMLPEMWSQALIATGGFCAPTPAVYDLEQISGSQRPLRDGLPSFMADRGGIRFSTPPNLSQILVDVAGGAVGEWTNVTDITPGGQTKSCQSIGCGAVVEVLTKAIYRCLGFGNFGARAFPENVRVWTLNAAAAWARKAEQEILDTISTNSTPVTSTGLYGYVPELLTHILQLSYGERSRQRMPVDARLRVLLPSWIIAQMQIDYLRQGNVETRMRTPQELRAMFDVAGVNVTFYEDSRTGAGQIVGPQASGVELRDLPEIVEWYLFHEGAHVHLTGGELDLGLVRDSTLNATNDFRIFAEEWAEVAFRGIFSYRVRSNLCPKGSRQVAVDQDPCGAS